MYAVSVPCHFCGHDNPADALHCAECQAVIRLRLRPTTTTQQLSLAINAETSEEDLIREAYFVTALLMQSVHRLKTLVDAKRVIAD